MSEIINLHKILSTLAQDDEASLEKLFNHYYPRLFNFSKSILKLEDGIDDILQEFFFFFFVKIWKNRKNIGSAANINSYIFTITRNLLLNELRRQLSFQNTKEEVKRLSLANEYSLPEQIDYQKLKEKIDTFENT